MPETREQGEYSPEVVRYYLVHWRALAEMAVGTSNGLFGRSTGGAPGGRITFAIIKADLSRAADTLPIYWQTTGFIFRRLGRSQEYAQRLQSEPESLERQYEPPIPSDALEQACYRMALSLGWRPEQEQAA